MASEAATQKTNHQMITGHK